MHLVEKIKCNLCNYKTDKKRLLLQHKNVHLRVKKFKYRKHCDQSFKHAMQHYRHEHNCTEKDD